jgi:hypothetical protein
MVVYEFVSLISPTGVHYLSISFRGYLDESDLPH